MLKTACFCVFFLILVAGSNTISRSNDSPNFETKPQQNLSWNEWIKKTKIIFKNSNIKSNTLSYLDSLEFNSRVIELDRKQPEFKLTFDEYLKKIVTKKNIQQINNKFKNNKVLLNEIEKTYSVDTKVLTALWGVETHFGNHLGKMDILRSLASLAYEGRRSKFFTNELKNALLILEKGHFERKKFKGSWAGAFGQTQFMPSTFLNYAVDFDGDEKKNLFNKADALASGANYLKKVGWDSKIPWGEKINMIPSENFKFLANEKKFHDSNFWIKNGVNLKKVYGDSLLRLVIPDSNNNQCYLVSKNFDVILDWNRSNYFALTVFLFSDEIK